MQLFKRSALVGAALLLAACSKSEEVAHIHNPVHIDIEASGAVYRSLMSAEDVAQAGALQPVLKMGERNLEWLEHMNSKIQGEKLSFSSKATQGGHPIDKPNSYSEKSTLLKFEELKRDMPASMREVILEGKAFTDVPPIETKDYLAWGLQIDKVYQTASRWLMLSPNKMAYSSLRQRDVRGYYNLSKIADIKTKLENFSTLAAQEQTDLKTWLLGMCFNYESSDMRCKSFFDHYAANGTILRFYERYLPNAEKLWNAFFRIGGVRPDIVWNSSNPDLVSFPFRDPKNATVEEFLKFNIEEEWQWGTWKLILNFLPSALTHVEFVPGTTPHVDGIAGSTITMDANAPLSEYDVQWTIRHEFGHVLGFPDCYVEFYVPSADEFVNYQLDVTNLMCSRKGALQEKHFTEMKRIYYKQ